MQKHLQYMWPLPHTLIKLKVQDTLCCLAYTLGLLSGQKVTVDTLAYCTEENKISSCIKNIFAF